ncbi:MAG: hypothetical protein U9R25_18925 [Chloroflexota bacterium]|nr:hypothetical protein [Chloroflexota bacterium]
MVADLPDGERRRAIETMKEGIETILSKAENASYRQVSGEVLEGNGYDSGAVEWEEVEQVEGGDSGVVVSRRLCRKCRDGTMFTIKQLILKRTE